MCVYCGAGGVLFFAKSSYVLSYSNLILSTVSGIFSQYYHSTCAGIILLHGGPLFLDKAGVGLGFIQSLTVKNIKEKN